MTRLISTGNLALGDVVIGRPLGIVTKIQRNTPRQYASIVHFGIGVNATQYEFDDTQVLALADVGQKSVESPLPENKTRIRYDKSNNRYYKESWIECTLDELDEIKLSLSDCAKLHVGEIVCV